MEFQFIRNLFHIKKDIGYSESELQPVCQRWQGMPSVLKDYYLQLGKHSMLNNSQNRLCEPDKLIDAKNYIIFYAENQYVAQWAVKKSDWHLDNPPVYCAGDEVNFELESASLTDFLNATALFQASFGLKYCCEEIYIASEAQAEQIRNVYKKYPYELKQWLPITFYGNYADEVIYLGENGDEYDLMYASENEKHFKELEEFIRSLELESY